MENKIKPKIGYYGAQISVMHKLGGLRIFEDKIARKEKN
jgi:hypothetical protein